MLLGRKNWIDAALNISAVRNKHKMIVYCSVDANQPLILRLPVSVHCQTSIGLPFPRIERTVGQNRCVAQWGDLNPFMVHFGRIRTLKTHRNWRGKAAYMNGRNIKQSMA